MKRLTLLVLAVFGTLLALAAPALAHVTVTAPGATRGSGDQEITFRVPVEKNSDTVGVTLALPTDTPIASVDVAPVSGWTHTEKTSKLAKPIVTDDGKITSAVTRIDWKARPGQGLAPGEFGSFTILAGQLPDAASITFKVLQTYSDGSVVRWIQTAAPGSTTEPANPAPTLSLAAGSAGSAAQTTSSGGSAVVADPPSNTGPIVLSVVALVLAAGALGLVVVGRARGRRST